MLIKPLHKKGNMYFVDIEYVGQTNIIKAIISALSIKEININWKLVGKKSKAHDVAYKVYVGKLLIGRKITYMQIKSVYESVLYKKE